MESLKIGQFVRVYSSSEKFIGSGVVVKLFKNAVDLDSRDWNAVIGRQIKRVFFNEGYTLIGE